MYIYIYIYTYTSTTTTTTTENHNDNNSNILIHLVTTCVFPAPPRGLRNHVFSPESYATTYENMDF